MAQPKQKKRFWDGKFWKTIREKAPGVAETLLNTAGDLTGVELLKKAGDLIGGDESIPQEDKVKLLELKQIELEQQRIDHLDRDSARNREVELAKTGRKFDILQIVTGSAVLLCFAVSIWYILNREIPNGEMAHFILGELLGLTSGIVFYYFGSSTGSKEKTQALARASEKAAKRKD